jgi:hypothetical protein
MTKEIWPWENPVGFQLENPKSRRKLGKQEVVKLIMFSISMIYASKSNDI